MLHTQHNKLEVPTAAAPSLHAPVQAMVQLSLILTDHLRSHLALSANANTLEPRLVVEVGLRIPKGLQLTLAISPTALQLAMEEQSIHGSLAVTKLSR